MEQSPIIDPKTGQPMNTAGAKAILGDEQLRAKQAAEEIRVILDAYDAELFPVMMLSPRGIVGVTVDVLPKKRDIAPMTRPATETPGPGEKSVSEAADEAADGKEAAPADEGDVPPEAEKAKTEVIDLNAEKEVADTVGDDGEVA